jgi:hypothetical protein
VVFSRGQFERAKQPWLKSCLRDPNTTDTEAGALTVAGQWRNFTAFPSILAIAFVNFAAMKRQPLCHGTIFHDINFYNSAGSRSQNVCFENSGQKGRQNFHYDRIRPSTAELLILPQQDVVTPGRLELPTRSLGNCCSIHLSYGATFRINIFKEPQPLQRTLV